MSKHGLLFLAEILRENDIEFQNEITLETGILGEGHAFVANDLGESRTDGWWCGRE